ncbi:MAG: SIS domain-containing protein, partial [Candidatus Dormibacteraeota bacterium]|nr:SIS domain-containing protein [Candidatus Dormibacteraeota bacterium]
MVPCSASCSRIVPNRPGLPPSWSPAGSDSGSAIREILRPTDCVSDQNLDKLNKTDHDPCKRGLVLNGSPDKSGVHIRDEIRSQPELWKRALALSEQVRSLLPERGARVAIVGCGTSYNVALSAAALREARGHGETDAFCASEVPARSYDAVIAISRSGTTTEVVRVLESLGDSTLTIAICATPDTPISRLASRVIDLDFADEESVVQTRFPTTVLALLRGSLGDDLGPAVGDAERALDDPLPDGLEGAARLVFLGRGWAIGLAHEAALKMRETAGLWAESYPALEYRHGPISVASRDTLVWTLGEVPPNLLEDIAATGSRTTGGARDPMAELVLVQRAALARA